MRTRALVLAATCVLSSSAAARADAFLAVTGGAMFPIGDDDWNNTVDAGPVLGLRGGGGRRVDPRSAVMVEASFEYAPLSDNFSSSLVSIDLTRYRALLGVRFERVMNSGPLVSLRGGVGISHLIIEAASPLLPNLNTRTDTGLALEVGAGVWFPAGPAHIGVELALPIGIHNDDPEDNNDIPSDFRTTEVSVLGGLRFSI